MNRAYEYALSWRKKEIPRYVKLQMKDVIPIYQGKNKKYFINTKRVKQIEMITKLLIMPKGLKAGQSLHECLTSYQWFFIISVLCICRRDEPEKRRYETAILEIARKNFKTYTVATLILLLFLMEPKFSKFYSVAPDGTLSKEVKEAIEETIKASPALRWNGSDDRFKLLRDYMLFKPNSSKFIPLNTSINRMDGRLPAAFIADEVGALRNNYPIEAMQSGQLNIMNKLGFIISTKYPTIDNPFEDYVNRAKKILDGTLNDETTFSLLYEPDEPKGWDSDDIVLKHANPVALEVKEIWKDLIKKRTAAIETESKRENFLTKHCNIIYQGAGTESYIDIADVQKCARKKIDWSGRVVYLGLDLSMTTDNTAVGMVAEEDGVIYGKAIAFIPGGKVEFKISEEKIDYHKYIRNGQAIPCGDGTIDYGAVEEFIMNIEKKYGVQVQAIGYDRYNCLSTAQKLENAGYNMVEIRQHSSVLHPATKLLKEKIINKEFAYEKNELLEINFQNAKCTYDTNQNMYINKKKSRGKVDMVFSLINAICLLEKDVFLNQLDFVIQS